MEHLTPEEQRKINVLAVALREVEHGCPGLSSPCQRAVETVARMMARREDRRAPASRPLRAVSA